MAFLPASLKASTWQTALAVIDRLQPRRLRTAQARHLATGEWGEEAAFFYLRRCGFIVIAQGWRSGKAPGDLDLVAWDDDTLCFVEVKTRGSRAFASAESAVDEHKRRSLRRLARHYLRQFPEGTPTRFDVLSVYVQPARSARSWEYELFRNAFDWQAAERYRRR